MLERLAGHGLIDGKTVGVDATTLEANAAMRSIVRRDTRNSYEDFLKELAHASGIETPTRAELARLDRKRPKKGSNDDGVGDDQAEHSCRNETTDTAGKNKTILRCLLSASADGAVDNPDQRRRDSRCC